MGWSLLLHPTPLTGEIMDYYFCIKTIDDTRGFQWQLNICHVQEKKNAEHRFFTHLELLQFLDAFILNVKG